MSVKVYGDNIYEGDERFYIWIAGQQCQDAGQSAPIEERIGSERRIVVIKDDDPPHIRLSASVSQLIEDDGKKTVTVTASTPPRGANNVQTIFETDQTITVAVGSASDTATEGVDYKTVADLTITIPKGQTSGTATFEFDPIDDAQTERESISLTGTSSTLPSTANINGTSIKLDDWDWPMALKVSPSTVHEANAGQGKTETVKVLVEGPGVRPVRNIKVRVVVGKTGDTAVEGTDYNKVNAFDIDISATDTDDTNDYGTFVLNVTDDSVDEGKDETEFEEISITGSASVPGLLTPDLHKVSGNELSVKATKLQIKDDDTADFAITVSPTSVKEGTKPDKVDSKSQEMTVKVKAKTAFQSATSIKIGVGKDTDSATSGTDYTAVDSFDIDIPAGTTEVSEKFTFVPTDDTEYEGNETVTVHGSSGSFDVMPGSFDITDDDYPVIKFSVTPDAVREDAVQPTVTVGALWDGSYTWPADKTVTVSFGKSTDTAAEGSASSSTCRTGDDYKAISDLTLTIKAGAKGETKSFIFHPCDDSLDEGEEYLTLTGSGTGVRFATPDTKLSIKDDDRLSIDLSMDPISFKEEADHTVVTISATASGLGSGGSVASDSTGRQIDLDLALGQKGDTAAYGVDYAKVKLASLSFSKDETKTTTFTFSPTDDSLIEGSESFSLVGTTTVGQSQEAAMAAASSGVGRAAGRFSAAGTTTVDVNIPEGYLRDNDLPDPSLSVSPSSVNEDDESQTVTVTLTDPKTAEVDVEYTISISSGSSATPGTDFATVSDFKLTISKGETSGTATFDLDPTDDTLVEGDEKIIVEIDHETLVANAQITLADDDTGAMALSAKPSSVAEDAGETSVALTVATDGDTFKDERVVTVKVGKSGDTAVEGTDYKTVADLTLKIPAGSTSASKSIKFTPIDDYVAGDTLSSTVSGTSTGEYTVSDATVSITDNDVIGALLDPTSLTLGEASDDRTGTYTVKLSSQPTGDVTVTLSSGDTTVATVKPKSLTFTSTTWKTAQTVTVTAVDDDIDNATDRSTKVKHSFSGADYATLEAISLPVTVTDDDTAGVAISITTGNDVSVDEDGGTGTYTIALDSEPTGNVTVTPASGDTSIATVSSALTFTANNWETAQTVTVTGVNDDIDNSADRTVEISHTMQGGGYGEVTADDVTAKAVDDDTRGITVSATSLSADEDGGTATYTVVLDSEPTGSVTVTPASSDTSIAKVSAALTFTTSNWETAQTVTVTAVNDDIDNASDRSATVSHTVSATGTDYSSETAGDVLMKATDDDVRGFTVSPASASATEKGGTASFQVVLDTEPTGSVTVTPKSSDTSVATVSDALAFTTSNWDTAQTVTVTGVDDSIDNSEHREATIDFTPSGADYQNVTKIAAKFTAVDDEKAAVIVSQAQVAAAENGGTASYTIALATEPTGNVTITPASANTSVAKVSGALTFTSTTWSTAQTVTVTAVNDDIDNDPDRKVTISHTVSGGDYGSVPADDVTATATDDDVRGLTVSPASASAAEDGGKASYKVRLNSEPTSSVTVTPASADKSVAKISGAGGAGALTFTTTNWSTEQTVTVTGVNDDIDNVPDRTAKITFSPSGADYSNVSQGAAQFTAVDDETAGAVISLKSLSADEDGGTATYTIVLATEPTANVTVTPKSSDESVSTVSDALTFTADNWSTAQTVTVTGVNDDVVNSPARTATISHQAAGGGYDDVNIAAVTVTATDDDTRGLKVSPTSASAPENGGTASYTVVLGSEPTGDVTVTPTSSDESVGTVSGTLTFTPSNWSSTQTVTVTGVDDEVINYETRKAEIEFQPSGADYGSVAAVSADFTTLDDEVIPTVVVSDGQAREDEGEMSFLVQLSEAIGQDVTIKSVTRDGTATDGEDYVDSPQSVTIEAGATEGTFVVPVLDDKKQEGDEDFELRIVETVNAEVTQAEASAIGTILDDDGDDALNSPQPRIVLWTDRLGYKRNQNVRVYRDIDPMGDWREYVVFYYRENIDTGERRYLAPATRSTSLRRHIVDDHGRSVGSFLPRRLARAEKELIWKGQLPDAGRWHFAIELRNPGTTQVVNAAYAKFVVAEKGTLLVNRPGVDRILATDTRWTSDTMYLVRHRVIVRSGATLAIEAGTLIRSYGPTAEIIVEQGGRIAVEGRREVPVVMTCDMPPGERVPGCWGGLRMLGKARAVAGPGDVETLSADSVGAYGGDRPGDSSGALRYLRVEFAGAGPDAQAASTAVAFHGVGEGTVIDHVQAHSSLGDGIEFRGGTAHCGYCVSSSARRDSLVWSQGWNGTAQHLYVQQGKEGGSAIHGTAGGGGGGAYPERTPTIYNATLVGGYYWAIGPGVPGSLATIGPGILLNGGAAATLRNLMVLGFADHALDTHDSSPMHFVSGRSSLRNAIFFSNGAKRRARHVPNDVASYVDYVWSKPNVVNVRYEPNPDPRPKGGSAARRIGVAAVPPAGGALSRSAQYLGAFGGGNWLREWTFFGDESDYQAPVH